MSNNTVSVVPASVVESVATLAGAVSLFDDNASALVKAAKAGDRAAFDTAWDTAKAAVGDTERVDAVVKAAESFVQTGRAAIDAHTAYRVQIVGIRREFLPKESKADLARALYGQTTDPKVQNTREQMVGRDLKALRVIEAMGPRRKVDVSEVLTVVNRATGAQMEEIVKRAAAGEPLAASDATAKAERQEAAAKRKAERDALPLDAAKAVTSLGDVSDLLVRVEHVSDLQRAEMLRILDSMAKTVKALPATPVESAETA